jgi:tRNA U34 2-thiouridine synthase MnmA/TrmU
MKNWDTTDEFGFCQSDKEAEEAEDICKQLDIPFHLVRMVKLCIFTALKNVF